ncbi:hypothetical protein [Nocardia sp. NBC_00416]|uniref:hypothetical protein n=1 Tax=Nocardia sp. NBC_00416 TaxID=2975991 RepID=UPI002E2266D8
MVHNRGVDVDTGALGEAAGDLADVQEALAEHSRTAAALWGQFMKITAGCSFSKDFIQDKNGQQGLDTQFHAVLEGNDSAVEVVGAASEGQMDAAESLRNVDIGAGHTIRNTVPSVTVKG